MMADQVKKKNGRPKKRAARKAEGGNPGPTELESKEEFDLAINIYIYIFYIIYMYTEFIRRSLM